MTHDADKTIDAFAVWVKNEEEGVCYMPLYLCEKVLKLLKEQNDALEQMRLDNEDLRKCYAELLKAQDAVAGWKDARHEMPDKQGDYLVFIPGEFHDTIMVARYSFNREIPWRGEQAHSAIEDVLFWMPLPKPPEKDGEQK